ncbi:hypothetical protein L6Q96_01675 [Candidatus Binatia bacterium]|nr:hypothetical protein [Candidatus Binatia bacterium]
MNHRGVIMGACALLTLGVRPAVAQHAHGDLTIGSTASGGGNLTLEYPLDRRPVVAVSDNGAFPGLFDTTDPGFMPAADEPPDIFSLNLGTTVTLELTDIDPNISLKVNATTLSAVGDLAAIATHDHPDPELSSLHLHPTFQLGILADANSFGEGRFSFRFKGSGYGNSAVYTLRVSNGYLPPLSALADPLATDDAKKQAVNCQKTVTKEIRKFWAKKHGLMSKCFDAVLAVEGLGKSAESAAAVCDLNPGDPKSLIGKIAAVQAKTLASIAKKCGPLSSSSTPFTDSAVQTHVGMASCRVDELIGSTYSNSVERLGEILGGECPAGTCVGGPSDGAACADEHDCSAEDDVIAAFGCLKMAQATD